jgi:4-amino-4-deoxy-L-arabinose transferase-like glycosyltransferase
MLQGIAIAGRAVPFAVCAIIAGGIALRLFEIDGSILNYHFIRQVDTAAIARNFAEEGMNILFPRIDWRGSSSGMVEGEFPLFTYSVALLYRLFGEHVEFARLLNLIFFALTMLVLFKLGKRLFDTPTALLAIAIYAFNPLAATFDHSFQPDSLLALATITTLYSFWRWCETGAISHLALSAVSLSIAILIKPLNLYLGGPLLYLAWSYFGPQLFKKIPLWLYGVAVLAPSLLWYAHAYQLWLENGNTLFRAYAELNQSPIWSPDRPFSILSLNQRSYASMLVWRLIFFWTAIGWLFPLGVGVVMAVRTRNYFVMAWAGAFATTMIAFAQQHYGHDYYQWPLVFIASLLTADGVLRMWRGEVTFRGLALGILAAYVLLGGYWFWIKGLQGGEYVVNFGSSFVWQGYFVAGGLLLLGFAILGGSYRPLIIAAAAISFSYATWQYASLTLPYPFAEPREAFGARLEALTDKNAGVVIAQHQYRRGAWFQHKTAEGELLGYVPVDFYLSRRKGWSITEEHATPAFIETLRQRGATHFAAFCCGWHIGSIADQFSGLIRYLGCAHTPLEVTETYAIFRLDGTRSRAERLACEGRSKP